MLLQRKQHSKFLANAKFVLLHLSFQIFPSLVLLRLAGQYYLAKCYWKTFHFWPLMKVKGQKFKIFWGCCTMLCVRQRSFTVCLLHWGAGLVYNKSTFNLPIFFKTSVSRTIKLQNTGCEKNYVIGSPIIYCGYC